MKNLISINTDDWIQGNTNSYLGKEFSYSEPTIAGHSYYTRLTWKYTTTDVAPTQFAFFLGGSTAWMGEENFSTGFPADTEYTRSGVRRASSSEIYSNGRLYSKPYSGVTNYLKEVMTIDITELMQVYPAFGALYKGPYETSFDPVIKQILDALPYISAGEEFEITHEYLEALDINISSIQALPILVY